MTDFNKQQNTFSNAIATHKGAITMTVFNPINILKVFLLFIALGHFLAPYAHADVPVAPPLVLDTQGIEVSDYREAWLQAGTYRRQQLAEQLAEEGARDLARKNGLTPIFEGNPGNGYRQGVDQVHMTPDGRVVVFEVKANNSYLNKPYGHLQGTPEYSVKAAERMLRAQNSSPAQKRAAEAIIKAAQEGKLETQVVRIRHQDGRFKGLVELNRTTTKSYPLRQMALEAEERLRKEGIKLAGDLDDFLRGAFRGLKRVTRWAGPVGILVEGGVKGYEFNEIRKQVKSGEIPESEAGRTYTEFSAGAATGIAGAWAGAKAGAVAGGAGGTLLGPVGTTVGAIGGAIAGGVGGAWLGEEVGHEAGDRAYDWWNGEGETVDGQP